MILKCAFHKMKHSFKMYLLYTNTGWTQFKLYVWCFFQAPVGKQVELSFLGDFGIYSHKQDECYHWVEVKYDDISDNGPRYES